MNNNNDFILLPLWYQLFARELLALRATQSLQGRNNAVIRLNGFITALVATGTITADESRRLGDLLTNADFYASTYSLAA